MANYIHIAWHSIKYHNFTLCSSHSLAPSRFLSALGYARVHEQTMSVTVNTVCEQSMSVSVLVPYVNKVCLLHEQSMSVYRMRRKPLVPLAARSLDFSERAKYRTS